MTIASPPVVTFKVADQNGTAIVGLGQTTKSATATVPTVQNLAFSLAKLVPGAPGLVAGQSGPSKWVSYIVTTVPTTTAAATGTRPSTDSNGTLVDNGDGTYKYTFFRDITQVKAQVAAMTFTGANKAADLGDLTYDPNAVHRLALQISGNVRGTGTNTPDGVQVVPAVPLAQPNNAIFDFIPATGKAVAVTDPGQRLVVDKLSCNECHGKLGGIPGTESASFHGGSRYDPRFCVVCHTDQRKFGQTNVVSTNNVFPAGSQTMVADGVTVGDFPVLIHRVHKGDLLVKQGYNFAGVLLNETKFPQDIRNCSKCHDGTAPKVAPQATNFKNVPSRLACGACHDGINFATGGGVTNAAFNQSVINGTTAAATGHVGGIQTDDSRCSLCHDATSIEKVYHVAVTPPNPANSLAVTGGNNNTNAAWIASRDSNLPAGAIKVSYNISSVSRDAAKHPVIVFQMLQNGVAVPFNTFGAKTEMWDNFMGSPSAYFVFAVPQDNVAAPADFNASVSGYLRSIWNGTATGAAAGTLTGPVNGFYTVTLTGVTIPDNAVMLTGGIGYTYGLLTTMPLTQTNLVDNSLADVNRKGRFATAAATATNLTAGMPNRTGGLIVIAEDTQKVATGYTGRRPIVEDKRCNACHEELGAFTLESFHAGQRNDGTTCSWCHNPNKTSSGWAADSTSFIHAIHAADKREKPFTWHASSTTESFANIGYPGILNRCETCHLPGTYDFSLSTSAAAADSRLYRYVASSTPVTATATAVALFSASPYITVGTNYGAGFSFSGATGATVQAADTNLVTSPTATVCFACHDASEAVAHMRANGGSIYAPRATALATQEQCLVCHASGKIADIKAVHTKP
ncbi:MAG TPA: OmcA/MtrC family decaheme c-type cytochrome [Ramlibacter sp.]|nr:OmcA/MtrC family decaheme c-type cytochrome [Ramlibacter sp.]